jgi:hypothetical protein
MSIDVNGLLSSSNIRKSEVEYLIQAKDSEELSSFLDQILERVDDQSYEWVPVGQQVNNQMIADITDNMTGLVENLTNISDAYLLKNYDGGNYNSSHDAAEYLLDSTNTAKMRFDGGSGEKNPSITFSDKAHGQSKDNFEVFVSPYESGVSKQKYDFLQGRRGVGGMTALSHTKDGDKFVASATDDNPESWTWTVIRQKENGDYYYLKINEEFPTFNGVFDCGQGIGKKRRGTVVKLYSYSLKTNPKDATNCAFRRRLSRYLPNPVSPIKIVDIRRDSVNNYTYTGLKDEIREYSSVFYDEITGSVDIFNIGEVSISVFIKKPTEILDKQDSNEQTSNKNSTSYTNILTKQNEPRMMINVNGQSHARYNKSNMMSETGIRGAGENMIILVEFDENTLEANDNIFNTGRDGFSDNGVEEQFITAISEFVVKNSKINEINNTFKERDDSQEIFVSNTTPLFDETIKCESGENITLKMDIEYNSENISNLSDIEAHINLLSGQIKSKCATFNDQGDLMLKIKPKFENNSTTVCKSVITDVKDNHTHTFVIEETDNEEKKETSKESYDNVDVENEYDSPLVSLIKCSNYADNRMSSNNVNNVHSKGDQFEDMVEKWIMRTGHNISSRGGKNHPPDYLLEEGPALEAKKVTSTGRVPTNSSPPESEITADNPRLKKETKDTIRNSSNPNRDMFYIIGDKSDKQVKRIWICQGKLLFGSHQLDEITKELRDAAGDVAEKFGIETIEDTNEVAKYNKIDSRDNISLRVRRMMSFNHPSNIFADSTPKLSNIDDRAVILAIKQERFKSLTESDKSSLKDCEDIKIQDVELEDTNVKIIVF